MLTPVVGSHPSNASVSSGGGMTFHMKDGDDRMAGSVPVWERTKTQTSGVSSGEAAANEFGFGDLLDMVNPLQHVPIVGTLYRQVTGDRIGPAAQIIGGSIYGGLIGGGAALANVIVEEETGRDVAGNVMALVMDGETPALRTASAAPDSPEERLTLAAADENLTGLPGTVLSFADLRAAPPPTRHFVADDDERTAGTMPKAGFW